MNYFTPMRLKPRFFAVLQSQRTTGNYKYAAKTAKEPNWLQSKRKPSAALPQDTRSLLPTEMFVEPQRTAACIA